VSDRSPEAERAGRLVLVETRDLVFRGKIEALIAAAGMAPLRSAEGASWAVVELSGEASIERVRALRARGLEVLAFGPHVQASWLRAAREAGAVAVPNSQLEAELRRWLAGA
jgi:hypothetical protein